MSYEVPKFCSSGVLPEPVSKDEQSLGSKAGLDPCNPPGRFPASSPELGTCASHCDAILSSKGSQNFSQALSYSKKCHFLHECKEPGGLQHSFCTLAPAAVPPQHKGLPFLGPHRVSQLLPGS